MVGRVQHAHPARQPKPHGPGAPPRVTGGSGGCRTGGATARVREAPAAVDRHRARQGRKPERSVHRGSCGAGFKHRARDAGELADLRYFQIGRRFIEKHRPA